MNFPKYAPNSQQERLGVNAVAEAVAKLGLIWRETPLADVGIDGQIEYVAPDGSATGQMVAVQVKSGPSFLQEQAGDWVFYPEVKHRLYWERFPLPVLIVLHDPLSKVSYWQDVRQVLRTPGMSQAGIIVPKSNVLEAVSSNVLFEGFAVSEEPYLGLDEVLVQLIRTRSNNSSFPISFFDLFCNGLTNICRSIYFGMDVALTVAELKLDILDATSGVGIGQSEHELLFSFVKFLVHQHLADVDFSDCLIDWHDRQMMPKFVAPLTSRGRELVERIGDLQLKLENAGAIPRAGALRAAQEDFVSMTFAPSHIARVALIETISAAALVTDEA